MQGIMDLLSVFRGIKHIPTPKINVNIVVRINSPKSKTPNIPSLQKYANQ